MTWDQSNYTMLTIDFWGSTFNFAQNVRGRMLDKDPESTKQLCRFFFKNSKDKRNGGVWDLDLPPIKEISVGPIFSDEVL